MDQEQSIKKEHKIDVKPLKERLARLERIEQTLRENLIKFAKDRSNETGIEQKKSKFQTLVDQKAQEWKEKLNKMVREKQSKEINEKLKLTPEQKEQFSKETERMNQYGREHPEALYLYLYHTGQIKDLTREHFVKINEHIRQEKKERGVFYHEEEIGEEEIEKYLQAQK